MHEIKINLHMHTRYSDGSGTHRQIAEAALRSGLDAVIITDHNVRVSGFDGYVRDGRRKVLVIVGEEIHDPAALPQRNHLLVIGAPDELSPLASRTQALIDRANEIGGLTFIAHPYEHPLPVIGEPAIPWQNWEVDGFTGIELWNALSELKSVSRSLPALVFHAFFPQFIAHGPLIATLDHWDQLTLNGRRVVAVGGSDAHALHFRAGPLMRVIFPYEFHFRSVNTHLLLQEPLEGDAAADRAKILDALRRGHAFIGNDWHAPTDGFRFTAQTQKGVAVMGDAVEPGGSATFQIRLPQRTECRLLCDGRVIRTWDDRDVCTHITNEPGVYRVEVYLRALGKKRGWIFSNPIYYRERGINDDRQ